MSLFRKNKKLRAAYARLPIPKWMIIAKEHLEERIVVKLKRYESRLNVRQKKMILFVFCAAMVCFFTFPVVTVILSQPNNRPRLFKHEAIIRPMDSRLDDSLDIELLKQFRKSYNPKKSDSITP